MADGNVTPLRAPTALRLVPAPPRKPSFRNYGGTVYLGASPLSPQLVEDLLALFQADAAKTGDWRTHDDLQAARDGHDPLPAA